MISLITVLATVVEIILATVIPPTPIPTEFIGTWAIFETTGQCKGRLAQQITIAADGTTTGSGINTATCEQSESIGWPGRVVWHCFRRDVCSWRWVSAGGLNPVGVASRHSPTLLFAPDFMRMTMHWSRVQTVSGKMTSFEQTYTKQASP